MMKTQLVLTGADFIKVKNELISCINAFWRFNTIDLCILTFLQDPIVPNSVVPVLMYDATQMTAFDYVLRTPTDEDEDTGTNHFDPITVSPPLVIHPSKWGVRGRVFTTVATPHTTPIPINPVGLKSKLQDGSIISLNIDYTARTFEFKTPLGFSIQEDPVFQQLGHIESIPFVEYALRGFVWKERSIRLVLDMKDISKAVEEYDVDESAKLFESLKLQGEIQTKNGIKVFIDFIKQKPLLTRIFNKSIAEDENMMSVCVETHYKGVSAYAFYAYATGW